MNAVEFGSFLGSFAMSLLFAAVWLLICKTISPLRRRPGISYGIAVAFSFIPSLVTIGGPSVSNVLAALLCAGLLAGQYSRAKEKDHASVPGNADFKVFADACRKRKSVLRLNPFFAKTEGMRRLGVVLFVFSLIGWFLFVTMTGDGPMSPVEILIVLIGLPLIAYLTILAVYRLIQWIIHGFRSKQEND